MIFGGFEPIVTHGTFSEGNYVQGFVVPVVPGRREEYRTLADRTWNMLEAYGARGTLEAWGEDVPHGKQTDFYRAVKAEEGESVVFSYIAWPSREVCDAAGQKMIEDPAMDMPEDLPFDARRMIYGGFEPMLVLEAGR
nr:DUF1428 domain-containing protein [Tsuneonella deserti]